MTRSSRARVVSVVAVAATSLTVLAACGGGGEDRLTRAAFVEQANAICTAGNEDIQRHAGEAFAGLGEGEAPGEREARAFAARLGPDIAAQLRELRELRPPEAVEDQTERVLAQADRAIDAIESDPMLVLSHEGPLAEVTTAFHRLGWSACGQQG